MKKFIRILSTALSLMLIFGAVSVSANPYAVMPIGDEEAEIPTVPVSLIVEGPETPVAVLSGIFAADGSVSAADAVEQLFEASGLTQTGLDSGYITSVGDIPAGIFGGWDGWMYLVKYYAVNEMGGIETYIDLPSVAMGDYALTGACSIVLYYGDFDDQVVSVSVNEDGKFCIYQNAAQYDENYALVGFTSSPLAGGVFTFRNTQSGEAFSFTADENGVLELSADLSELPNGDYLGYAGKQSEETAMIGDVQITKPEVIRFTEIYHVYNEPDPAELLREFRKKMMCMFIG